MSDKPLPGHKGNPIEISDPSEARANLSYTIKPKARKEQADGEALPRSRSKDRSEG